MSEETKKTKAAEEATLAEESASDDMFDAESSGGSLYKWEKVGQSVKGLVIERREGKTAQGPAIFYTINTGKEEVTMIPTKALQQDLDKYYRQFGGAAKVIVQIDFVDEKKGAYASPFKVFKVRAGASNEQRLAALGISTFDEESTSTEESVPM